MARLSAVLAVAIPHLILCRRNVVNPLLTEQAQCQFPCGSKDVVLPYGNGEEIAFQLGVTREKKFMGLASISYVPRNDQCLKQCVVVGPDTEHNTGAGQVKSWLHKKVGQVQDTVMNTDTAQEKLVSCEQVVLGGQKVATALTKNGTRVKLCCANQECPRDAPLAPQPGPGQCFFACGQKRAMIDYTRHDKGVTYRINMTIGEGNGIEYKPRDDYCLSECKWFASHLDDRLIAEKPCHVRTNTPSIPVARASYGKGHEGRLCCIPMKPKECPVQYGFRIGDTVWAERPFRINGKLVADVGDEATYLGPGQIRPDGRSTLRIKLKARRDGGDAAVDALGRQISRIKPIKTIEDHETGPGEPSDNATISHEPILVSGEV